MKTSRYTISFETITGINESYTWNDIPLRQQHIATRPHAPNGLNFKRGGVTTTIPWHQIKKSSFIEKLMDIKKLDVGAIDNLDSVTEFIKRNRSVKAIALPLSILELIESEIDDRILTRYSEEGLYIKGIANTLIRGRVVFEGQRKVFDTKRPEILIGWAQQGGT